MTDAPETLEKYYNEFAKLPKTKSGKIKKKFLCFPRWTDENDIFKWFDKTYPGGLLELMNKRISPEDRKVWEELNKKISPGIAHLLATPPDLARMRCYQKAKHSKEES